MASFIVTIKVTTHRTRKNTLDIRMKKNKINC
jgi:hypothetical protein